MNIPENKLPLKLGGLQKYGQYGISFINKENSIPTIKYVGQIAYKDLSHYIVKAANKFPEALKLLSEYNKYKDSVDTGFKIKVEEFLNSL